MSESARVPPEIPIRLIESLRAARRVVVLTGAGISAESGVPTFRDAQTGLWSKYKPENLATPEAFQRHPKLVWDWYAWRRERVQNVVPNPGHLALVELERKVLFHRHFFAGLSGGLTSVYSVGARSNRGGNQSRIDPTHSSCEVFLSRASRRAPASTRRCGVAGGCIARVAPGTRLESGSMRRWQRNPSGIFWFDASTQ